MYSFQIVMPIGATTTTLQIAYPSHEDSDDHLRDGVVQIIEEYNRRLPPSRLLFVCPCGMEKAIGGCFEREDFEDRLVSTSHIAVAPYDKHGKLASKDVVHLKENNDRWDITDAFLLRVAQDGISALFDDTKTILLAPHGYVFRKPSGREMTMFVRAGNMLREPGCMSIFNHLLLRKLPPNCSLVYIDSFTILSFAISLQSIVRYFRRSDRSLPALAIESTHSYEISPDFRIPNEKNYFVLISASTSGGLAQKLVDEYHAEPNRIVHLLGIGPPDSEFKESCVYFRAHESKRSQTTVANQSNAAIEIGTEEFLVAQGPPRPVRITTRHVNDDAAREFHRPFYCDALQFGEPSTLASRSYSPFAICNETEHATSSPARHWVDKRLIHELPASVHTLVYVDNKMSEEVAKWIAKSLRSYAVPKSLEEVEADAANHDTENGSFVVIAHHDPGLEGLARASIALRRLGSVHRHYVVCYGFPSSRMEHERLRSDLRMAPGGAKYGWSEFMVLPVGVTRIHDPLVSHRSRCTRENMMPYKEALGNSLVDALDKWSVSKAIAGNRLFLPRTCSCPLALRHGSIFFRRTSEEATISQIAVYAMVSAAIQNARDPVQPGGIDRPPEMSFDDNPFVRSVLDPSMFARFSDGILQASLLRAAQRSELDYSASYDFSRQFTSTFISVLVNHKNSVGDAALEYVYALATDKVLLRDEDRKLVRKEIDAEPIFRACWQLFRTGGDH